MWSAVRCGWHRLCVFCTVLSVLRGPVIATALGVLLLRPDQAQEVLRVIASDVREFEPFDRFTLAVGATMLAAFAIWLLARLVSLSEDVPDDENTAFRIDCLVLTPIVLPAFYIAHFAYALSKDVYAQQGSPTWARIILGGLSLYFAGLFCVAALLLVWGFFAKPPCVICDRWLTRYLFGRKPTFPSSPMSAVAWPAELYLIGGFWGRIADQWRKQFGKVGSNLLAKHYGLEPFRGGLRIEAQSNSAPTDSKIHAWTLSGIVSALQDLVRSLPTAPVTVPILFVVIILPILLFLTPVVLLFYLNDFPQWLGAVAIMQIFVFVLLIVLTFYKFRRAPVIAILSVIVIWSLIDFNDNHHIRPLEGIPAAHGDVVKSFRIWLRNRADKKSYHKHYPVYVVAARGGGIYAAYHAAMFMARVQDRCPTFAQHVFAISAVSGGSLGAATFAALAKELAKNTEGDRCGDVIDRELSFSGRSRKMLATDFLAPTLSAALFPDLVMQAVPTCPDAALCLKGLDRARALERAFEIAWADAFKSGSNPFEQSVYGLWSGTDATPALLLNTTEVETGGRVVIAPFSSMHGSSNSRVQNDGFSLDTLLERAPWLDLRLSTAVGLSARFPILTPAGWYMAKTKETKSPRKRRLVDGGYYDNSGIATALDVIEVLISEAQNNQLPIDIRLIVLMDSENEQQASYAFSELLSVTDTLLRAREEHSRRIEELARKTIQGQRYGIDLSMHEIKLGLRDLPLGWQLAGSSRKAIEQDVERYDCQSETPPSCDSMRPIFTELGIPKS